MNPLRHQDRTESVQEKLKLLQAAYQAGDLDLAMSLTESTKDTLLFERQTQEITAEPVAAAEQFVAVESLPKPWAAWAQGWSHCKIVQLFETVGIERSGEPVELALAFREDQATDLSRELRVARVDPTTHTLLEIPSQVIDSQRRDKLRHCRIVFAADVPAHQQASYFIFFGNPLAERPDYLTDLRTRGEGVGLDIENHYYTASLSRQMGQLERLVYKRQHGLELYAGGKGHGEPPGADWGHDYVDAGHFQKFRMRNWSRCINHDVVRGPLCTRVRRWGFPHSPIHPVFTPSRIHMDQTYAFYAGLPYFFKESAFSVVKDVDIEAMRDDEWVFSGYSFTDEVWIDPQGKLREGAVPPGSENSLWGVGFYNRTSHDAFIALRLEHAANGFDIAHGGVPTLQYDGHGQLWSRYPAQQTRLKTGTVLRQKNAYLMLPFEGADAGSKVEQLRHQLLHPLEARVADVPRAATPSATGSLARFGETKQTAPLKPAIWKAIQEVHDEQLYKIDVSIVDLGYIYDVRERNGIVSILVSMPHRGRPVYQFLVTTGGGRIEPGIYERVKKVAGVRDVVVEMTWNPEWNISRLSDAGRKALGLEA